MAEIVELSRGYFKLLYMFFFKFITQKYGVCLEGLIVVYTNLLENQIMIVLFLRKSAFLKFSCQRGNRRHIN